MPDLFPYQIKGRDFLVNNARCMLGDQPGLGKTAQSLSALMELNVNLNVCVICPRVAIGNWRREISKWGADRYGFNFLITNYEQLVYDTPDQKRFLSTDWDAGIIDEAHRLKNVGAKRTQIIYRNLFKTPYVWLLTGTPARNHAGELWTHLRALRPDLIKTSSGRTMGVLDFEDKYCRIASDPMGRRKVVGSKNMGELRNLLETSGFFMRRLKTDVLQDLPKLIFDTYELPGVADPYKGADLAAAQVARAKYYQLIGMSDDEVCDFMRSPDTDVPLSSATTMLGLAKAPLVADLVLEELEAPGKIIVFYHNTDVGDVLERRLGRFRPARVGGDTKDVMAEVDRFQEDYDCRVFLGQISACQEALNLTAANQVIFAQASWSPSDNEQAASRAHRIGMQDSLVVRFCYLPGTLDEPLMRVLKRKTDELNQLFG